MLTVEKAKALAVELAYPGVSPVDVADNIFEPDYHRITLRRMPDGGILAVADVWDDETGSYHSYRWFWDPEHTLIRIEQEIAGRVCVLFDKAARLRGLMEA